MTAMTAPAPAARPRPGPGLSLRAKVLGSYLAVLVIFGTVLGFALWQMAATRSNISGVASGYMVIAREVDALRDLPLGYALEREGVDWLRYRPNLDLMYLDQSRMHLERAVAYSTALQSRLESPVEAAALREVLAQMELVVQELGAYGRDHARLAGCVEAQDEVCAAWVAGDLAVVRAQISADRSILSTKIENRIQYALETAGETQIQASRQLLWLSSTAIVLAGVMLLLVHLSLRPIDRLIRGTRRVAEGRYDERVDVGGHDEIGKLAEAFNTMSASLAQREVELLKMERLATVGRMAAQVAHEIRNPLNALSLNAELLGDDLDRLDEPHRAEARETLTQLQEEIERLAQITETYLSLARLPSPEREPGDLGEAVRRVAGFVGDELAGAGVRLELEIDGGLPEVALDDNQMRQALLNLLRNAIEAQPDGGAVFIAVRAAGGVVELEIRDRGGGVPEELRDTIFDPFVTTKERGTGLGLAITRQIIEGHNGSIVCHGAPGGGTVFRIRLPVVTMPTT